MVSDKSHQSYMISVTCTGVTNMVGRIKTRLVTFVALFGDKCHLSNNRFRFTVRMRTIRPEILEARPCYQTLPVGFHVALPMKRDLTHQMTS